MDRPESEPKIIIDPLVSHPLSTDQYPEAQQQMNPGVIIDPLVEFLGNLGQSVHLRVEDVPHTLEGIQSLASAGNWRGVDEVSDTCLVNILVEDPLTLRLQYELSRVTALLRLREYHRAATLIDALGDLDSQEYTYERYPDQYPNKKGSMIPFALRLYHAKIPFKLGKSQLGLDRLSSLLSKCRVAYETTQDGEKGEWGVRERWVSYALATHHALLNDYVSAINVISLLVSKFPRDHLLLSKLGTLYLKIGAIRAAEDVFERVECFLEDADSSPLVKKNRGFVLIAQGHYGDAAAEFRTVFSENLDDHAAACALASCLIHLREHQKAVEVLEATIKNNPSKNTTPLVIRNLCLLYDLQPHLYVQRKVALKQLVERVCADDFDSAAFTI
eukprot:TRINITY_DN15813_c0_g1::TRINITY_DN15813_c0_g1_i1::g.25521::m.25521 TRINITY_DN15813_c0_g1::TRINITY_DN15813_c0_g1_i1::g.25521  ORF type:complete len:404 (-),score=22.42,sp/Q8K2L8/TPC12_MOUSE/26.98/4e-32,TPR_16/PF13432.1/1.5e+02,TPR_16/PF13432.1/0.043,TPR_16/PF13432.1/2.1e-05,TPR_14/PF13428.1/6.7e+02,TPR_14/PF13428.1/8.8,TPR_14/PF13428.1/1.7e+02,TPR_14/PF13428.1/0.096,TPR_14/PF13428.1/0.53,TPR_11/PF13414.1/7.1e+03,TPR_11/PF13414.1/0.15,TPR_11/PF13414.1/0.0004,TPR_2/PF07719.12/2.1e+03,TPR_2/PF07719.1